MAEKGAFNGGVRESSRTKMKREYWVEVYSRKGWRQEAKEEYDGLESTKNET